MKKNALLILAVVIIGIIVYVTFVIALIKITLGLFLLAIAFFLLWLFWKKFKNKAEDKF